MSDFVYADIVILSSNYREMQDLLEAVNRHAASVGITRNNASKIKVISVLITCEQRLAAVLDGEQLD